MNTYAANLTKDTSQHAEVHEAFRACRAHIASAAVFSLGINLLYLALPLYMLQVYDRVLGSGSVPTLVMLTVACLIALATLAALDIVRSRVLIRSGLRLDHILARRVLTASVARANDVGGDERGQVIRDLDTIRHTASGPSIHALFDAPWAPVYIAVIFLIHPFLGTLALLSAVVLFLLALLNEYVTRRAVRSGNESAAQTHAWVEGSLRNAEVIQALGMLQDIARRWLVSRRSTMALQSVASDRSAWITGAIKFTRLFMQALMLGLGAYLVIDRSITAGAMFASAIILGRALQPVEQLVGNWRPLIAGRDALARMSRLFRERAEPASRVSLPRPRGHLAVENVVYARPELTRPVLNGVSFELEPGEALAIVGPTAAGKSTLARLLIGLHRPTSGAVRLDGADVATWNRDELGRHVGYLPQDIELFSGTVAENISRFRDASSEAIVAAATLAGAHTAILSFAEGYETQVGEGGSRLSGGQRQRIALARAVFENPSFVVLDEPNSNLDAEGETALGACLKRLKDAGTTVVLISHRMSAFTHVDKVLYLRAGAADAFGPRDEILMRLMHAVPTHAPAPPAARVQEG